LPRQRVEIGGVDLAVQPYRKTEVLSVNILDRTMADAMDGMTAIGQRANEMPPDEPIGAGDPHCHGRALCPTNE